MKKRNKLLGILLFSAILLYALTKDFTPTVETVYVNGNILTLGANNATATAMHVKNGVIQQIGAVAEMDFSAGEPRYVDLKGATVLPGFIDSHSHVALSSFTYDMVDLSGFTHRSNAAVWEALKVAVQNTPKGEWIIGKGIDIVLVPDLVLPTLQFLDAIAPDNPVMLISQSLHSYWGNTAAFTAAGITKESDTKVSTSYYEKDAAGNLSGGIVEQLAFLPFLAVLNKDATTPKKLTKATTAVFKTYAALGNTTVVSAGITINDAKPLRLYEHVSSNRTSFVNQLLSVGGLLPKRTPMPRHFMFVRHDRAFLFPTQTAAPNDFYGIIGVKHWYDGSPYTGSMYLESPYEATAFSKEKLHVNPGHTGKALIEAQALKEFISTYTKKGWQIAIHTQGDQAIKEVLAAYENLSEEFDFSSARNRLEHCLLATTASIHQMKKLGITPSYHINHLLYYGDVLETEMLSSSRVNRMLPLKSTLDAGVKFTLHADQPMFDSHPFRLIQTAVERKTTANNTIGAHERIPLLAALKSMTIHAAWQIHKEDKIGSLEKGKLADFIVVDANPFDVAVEKIGDIQVLQTFVHGNEVLFKKE